MVKVVPLALAPVLASQSESRTGASAQTAHNSHRPRIVAFT